MADMIITNIGKTEGKRYMISDAARLIDVESHVLRYWEEELDIEIPRNEMGHRYYTDYYIQAFRKIKELKDQGFLLKAIKIALPEIMNGGHVDGIKVLREESALTEATASEVTDADTEAKRDGISGVGTAPMPVTSVNVQETGREIVKNSKIEQFQMILGNVVTAVLQENNRELTREMSKNVSDSVIKEMDYLLRMKEEREEERFKKFDEMVRGLQKDNKLSAMKGAEKKRRFFGKK